MVLQWFKTWCGCWRKQVQEEESHDPGHRHRHGHLSDEGLCRQVTVNQDGTTATHTVEGAAYFDFATYQFLFPFLRLREGMAFRLSGYEYLEQRAEVLPVKIVGRVKFTDARGAEHDAWQVDVMPAHRATLITFYVSEEPPFFYGWDYRLTRDGATAIKLTLRGWTPVVTERMPQS